MKKKYPDQIVFDYDKQIYDSNIKKFPTTIGSPNFKPLKIDNSSTYNAKNYFNSRFEELKKEYEELLLEMNWTKILYDSEYSFQPITGKNYYLYKKKNNSYFLSLIEPNQWNKNFIGTFCLQNNGTWKKIEQNEHK